MAQYARTQHAHAVLCVDVSYTHCLAPRYVVAEDANGANRQDVLHMQK